MSANEADKGAAIAPDSALGRALGGYDVPDLPAGFTDRVLAAAAARPAPLPELRRSGGTGGAGRWRLGRRIAIGMVGFGALASAAAATGLLERAGLTVPSPEKVWASISGQQLEPESVAPAPVAPPPPADPAPLALAPVRIEGAIDTPEELAEAFRRIDEVRQGRIEQRRERIEARIAAEKQRREAAGLPLPTPEQEARARARIEEVRARREGLLAERIEARRAELEGRVEAGEAIMPGEIVRPIVGEQRAIERRERIERLRRMTPQQRREALDRLPPAQRRELVEAWRERQRQRLQEGVPAAVDVPAPEAAPGSAGEAEPEALSRSDTPAEQPPR